MKIIHMIDVKYFYPIIIKLVFCSILCYPCLSQAQEKKEEKPIFTFFETKDQKEQRMQWWRDAKFGMFIHWGPDAVPSLQWKGNEWNKKTLSEKNYIKYPAHESILNIPKDDWENEVIKQFNPTQYNPEDWVLQAKKAGMKYIILTVKHHNGFCLWPGLPGYDIRETKFKGDPVAMFVEACRKYDMRIGFYYSQLDWHDPDAIGKYTAKTYPDGWISNPEKFLPTIKSQIKDLLTQYGKIDILWFDGQWIKDWTTEMGDDLTTFVRTLQPDIIINDRVRKGTPLCGDYHTPEQIIPSNGISGAYWETCMTMNDTWFYVKQDLNWKSSNILIKNLIDVSSKDGNFLLNVGPDPDGVIPLASRQKLDSVGQWIDVNAESIYSTSTGPFETTFPWGSVTAKDDILYLHILNVPEDRYLKLPFFDRKIRKVSVLADHSDRNLSFEIEEDHYKINLPEDIRNKIVPVIKVKCW